MLMAEFVDLASMNEDQRIEMIGERVMQSTADQPVTAGFVVDHHAADRYIRKLQAKFPGIRILDRVSGPTSKTVTVRVTGPIEKAHLEPEGADPMAVIPASPEAEAFYQECLAGMRKATERHPEMRVVETIATIGRLAGYCIATCHPEERDLARQLLIRNMDAGTAAVAQPGPTTAGHA